MRRCISLMLPCWIKGRHGEQDPAGTGGSLYEWRNEVSQVAPSVSLCRQLCLDEL